MTDFATTTSPSSVFLKRPDTPAQTTEEDGYWSPGWSPEDRRRLNLIQSGDSVPSLSDTDPYRPATYRSTDVAPSQEETEYVHDHTTSVPSWVREAVDSRSLKEYFDPLKEYSSSDDSRGEDSYSVHPSTNTPDDQLGYTSSSSSLSKCPASSYAYSQKTTNRPSGSNLPKLSEISDELYCHPNYTARSAEGVAIATAMSWGPSFTEDSDLDLSRPASSPPSDLLTPLPLFSGVPSRPSSAGDTYTVPTDVAYSFYDPSACTSQFPSRSDIIYPKSRRAVRSSDLCSQTRAKRESRRKRAYLAAVKLSMAKIGWRQTSEEESFSWAHSQSLDRYQTGAPETSAYPTTSRRQSGPGADSLQPRPLFSSAPRDVSYSYASASASSTQSMSRTGEPDPQLRSGVQSVYGRCSSAIGTAVTGRFTAAFRSRHATTDAIAAQIPYSYYDGAKMASPLSEYTGRTGTKGLFSSAFSRCSALASKYSCSNIATAISYKSTAPFKGYYRATAVDVDAGTGREGLAARSGGGSAYDESGTFEGGPAPTYNYYA
ncbi:uncharacterized protein MKK02DRAFT_31145 [Dioszegia hungarica]|uniref:Uncharacterized protein n=1 Tax=Dioszegia hungarica TaxID=4972 RepID=A0AA38LWW7_9TREE|nr:uncharacterized protein MKK02DRAFT_31145 [Dioszegia hungarica]KAI9638835.1 hypothetical protein MKK02DRAFT_31145 [Dioszegia hungarica]